MANDRPGNGLPSNRQNSPIPWASRPLPESNDLCRISCGQKLLRRDRASQDPSGEVLAVDVVERRAPRPAPRQTSPSLPPCPTCGQATVFLLEAQDPCAPDGPRYQVHWCPPCAQGYTRPAGDPAASYGDAFYLSPRAETLLAPLYRLFHGHRLGPLLRHAGSGPWLDWGAGNGAFAAYVERRTDRRCLFHEPSTAGRRLALARQLLEVDLERDGPFGAISLWHVLEHLERPRDLLDRLRPHLAPDGVLVVSVPNLASLQAVLFGSRWFHLDVPRHRRHFSPRGLRGLLVEAGFAVVEELPALLEYEGSGSLQSLLNLLQRRPNELYRGLKGDVAALRRSVGYLLPASIAAALLTAGGSFPGAGAALTMVARPRV